MVNSEWRMGNAILVRCHPLFAIRYGSVTFTQPLASSHSPLTIRHSPSDFH
jgi:hypothetical protein